MPTPIPTCLVIEDDQDARDALMLFLSISNIKAAAAVSRDDALKFLAKEVPAVILMDLWMPGLAAPAFVVELQKCTPPPKLIVMTALHDAETATPGLRFDAFLPKPLDMDLLLSTIRRLSGYG